MRMKTEWALEVAPGRRKRTRDHMELSMVRGQGNAGKRTLGFPKGRESLQGDRKAGSIRLASGTPGFRSKRTAQQHAADSPSSGIHRQQGQRICGQQINDHKVPVVCCRDGARGASRKTRRPDGSGMDSKEPGGRRLIKPPDQQL